MAKFSTEFLRDMAKETNNQDVLHKLADHKNIGIQHGVVSNPHTHSDTLELLYKRSISDNRAYPLHYFIPITAKIARHPNTPSYILSELSKNSDNNIRYSVASNPNTPHHILHHLANNDCVYVKTGICTNPNIPHDIINKFMDDSNVVVELAYHNHNLPDQILDKLSKSKNVNILRGVASNKKSSVEILHRLSTHKDVDVVWNVAFNPNTHSDTLKKLQHHNDSTIQSAANEMLKRKIKSINNPVDEMILDRLNG